VSLQQLRNQRLCVQAQQRAHRRAMRGEIPKTRRPNIWGMCSNKASKYSKGVEPAFGGLHARVCFCDDISPLAHDGAWWGQPLVMCNKLVGVCEDVNAIGVDFRDAAAESSDALGFFEYFFLISVL
jgi:hypothetical protein